MATAAYDNSDAAHARSERQQIQATEMTDIVAHTESLLHPLAKRPCSVIVAALYWRPSFLGLLPLHRVIPGYTWICCR